MVRRSIENKKAKLASVISFLFILICTISLTYLVFASPSVTTNNGASSYSVNEDTNFTFNITINNTDTGEVANITWVNITLQSSLIPTLSTNGTDASGVLSGSSGSNVLMWYNTTGGYVINGSNDFKHFWFNASSLTPAVYNITVDTFNSTDVSTSNITVTINDTTSPSLVNYSNFTSGNNTNVSAIMINISAEDNGVISAILIELFNSTHNRVNYSSSATSPLFANFTGHAEGTYYFNATVNDTYNNINTTTLTRTVLVDTTDPVIVLSSPADHHSTTTTAINFTFNVTDLSEINSCSLILNNAIINTDTSISKSLINGLYNSSLSVASYNWSINCTDIAGNTANTSTRRLNITSPVPASTTTSGGSDSSYTVFSADSEDLSKGYNKIMLKNWKISFKFENENHEFKLDFVNTTDVGFTINSITQKASLKQGEEKKFEITGDTYFDLLVRIDKIDFSSSYNPRANITLLAIKDSMTLEEQESKANLISEESNGSDLDRTSSEDQEDKKEESFQELNRLWIFLGIILILSLIFLIYRFLNKPNFKLNSKNNSKK